MIRDGLDACGKNFMGRQRKEKKNEICIFDTVNRWKR